MKNFFKWIFNFIASFFRFENGELEIKTKVKTIIRENKELKLQAKFLQDKYIKAFRNQNKSFATTKSFNGRLKRQFLVEELNNEDKWKAQHYLRLVERKKILDQKNIKNSILQNKHGTKISKFNKWQEERLHEFRMAI